MGCAPVSPGRGNWKELLVSVNQEFAAGPKSRRDELAFFPPVSGGTVGGDPPQSSSPILIEPMVPTPATEDGAGVVFDGIVRTHSRAVRRSIWNTRVRANGPQEDARDCGDRQKPMAVNRSALCIAGRLDTARSQRCHRRYFGPPKVAFEACQLLSTP